MAWIGAAIGAAGVLGSALLSKSGGSSARSAARTEAQTNREFQERMSSTSHQREVKDLIAAGLNPILSAGGRGASSPSGAVAPIQDVLTPAVNTAMTAKRLMADLKQITASTAKTKVEKDLVIQQHDESETRESNINAQNIKTHAETANIKKQNQILERALVETKIDAKMLKEHPWLRWLERLLPSANSAKSLIGR